MPSKNQSIILGVLVTGLAGVLMAFVAQANQYLGILACCVPGIAGALVAVWHYTDSAQVTISSGDGAKIGAITGVLGGLVSFVLTLLLQTVGVLSTQEEMMEAQRQQLEAQGMSPEQIDQAMQFGEMFTGTTGLLAGLALGIVIGALIGGVGGAIGAAMFKKGGDIAEA